MSIISGPYLEKRKIRILGLKYALVNLNMVVDLERTQMKYAAVC